MLLHNIVLLLGGLVLLLIGSSACFLSDCDCEKTVQIPSMKPLLQKVLLPPIDLCKPLELKLDLCALKYIDSLFGNGYGMCSKKDILSSTFGTSSCCRNRCKGAVGSGLPCGYTTHPAIIDYGRQVPAYAPPAYGTPAYGTPAYAPPAYAPPAYAPPAYGSPVYDNRRTFGGPPEFTEFGDGFPVSPIGSVPPFVDPSNFGPPTNSFGPPGTFGPPSNEIGPPPGSFGLRSLTSDTPTATPSSGTGVNQPLPANPQNPAKPSVATPTQSQQLIGNRMANPPTNPPQPQQPPANRRLRPQGVLSQQQPNQGQQRTYEDLNAAQSQIHYQYSIPDDLETSESNMSPQYENINQQVSDDFNNEFHDEEMIFDSSRYDLETSESNITPEYINMNQEITLPQEHETNDEEMVLNLHISIPPELMQQHIKQYLDSLNLGQNIETQQNTDDNSQVTIEEVQNSDDEKNAIPLYVSEGSTINFNDNYSDLDTSETNINPRNINLYDNYHYIAESKTASYSHPEEAKSSRLEKQPEEIHLNLSKTSNYGESLYNNLKLQNTQNFNYMQTPHIPRRRISMQNYLLKQDPFKLDFNVTKNNIKDILQTEIKNNDNSKIKTVTNMPQPKEKSQVNEKYDTESYDELIENNPLRSRSNLKDSEITSEAPRHNNLKSLRQSKNENIQSDIVLEKDDNKTINLPLPRRNFALNNLNYTENKNTEKNIRINSPNKELVETEDKQHNRLNPRFQPLMDNIPSKNIPASTETPKPLKNKSNSQPTLRKNIEEYPEYPEYPQYPEDYYDQSPPLTNKEVSRQQMTKNKLTTEKSQNTEINSNLAINKTTSGNYSTQYLPRNNNKSSGINLLGKQGLPQLQDTSSPPKLPLPFNYPSQKLPNYQPLNYPSTSVPNYLSHQRSRHPLPQVPTYPQPQTPNYTPSNTPSYPSPENPTYPSSQIPHYPQFSQQPKNPHHQYNMSPLSRLQYDQTNHERKGSSLYKNYSPQFNREHPHQNHAPSKNTNYPFEPESMERPPITDASRK